MRSPIFTIMKKELARFFTDRRMAFTTIFLPGIMIYLIYSFMGSALSGQFSTDDGYKPSIYVTNLPESVEKLAYAAKLDLNEAAESRSDELKQQIEDGNTDLYIVFPEDFDTAVENYSATDGKPAPNIEMFYNSSDTDSYSAFNTVTVLLDGYEAQMINKFDINRSDSEESDSIHDLAKEEDEAAQFFSSMLPMLLMIFMFSGCMAVAPESIAGEKERGTIATMLITPTKRSHIAIGKIFALSVIALSGGLSSTIGTILALPKLMQGQGEVVTNVYGVADYTLLAVVILSTVLLLVAAVSIISAFAKTIKEAQTYVMPLMIVTMLVGVTAMFGGGIKTDIYYYLIPLYNSVQCMVGIFSFDINPAYFVTTVAANLAYTAFGVFVLTKMFNSEKIIFSK